jgi:hypothetical protein
MDIHWNSPLLRARSHMTSHYTRGSVTTLRDFGGVLGRPLDNFSFVLSQFHGYSSWLMCEVALISLWRWSPLWLLEYYNKTNKPILVSYIYLYIKCKHTESDRACLSDCLWQVSKDGAAQLWGRWWLTAVAVTGDGGMCVVAWTVVEKEDKRDYVR